MISVTVSGRRMDQHGQALTIEHQPGNDFGKLVVCEQRLIHRLWMRSDGLVMPAAKLNIEVGQPCAYLARRIAGSRIVVYMGVIAFYFTLAHEARSVRI